MTFAQSDILQVLTDVYFGTLRHIGAKRRHQKVELEKEGGVGEGDGRLCFSTATFRLISQEHVFIPHAGGDVMGNINIIPWPEKTRLY